jgi:hypothetical protein
MRDAFFVGYGALDACSGIMMVFMIFGVVILILSVIGGIAEACQKKPKDNNNASK